jgi:hypothetical protein
VTRSLPAAATWLIFASSAAATQPWTSLDGSARAKAELVALATLGKDICSKYDFDDAKVSWMIHVSYPGVDVKSNEFLDHAMWFLSVLVEYASVDGENALCRRVYKLLGPDSPLGKISGPAMTKKEKK